MRFELRETTIHGHRVAYRLAGSGPPIVLIHGITSSSVVWELVGPQLACHHTVLAPDLLGHGQSAKPRTERLALVSSGGLGRTVHGLLRAATLPGSELVLPLLAGRHVLNAGRAAGRAFGRVGLQLGNDAVEIARGHASLEDPESRAAFVHTLRASLDGGGQRVQALDRLYLAEEMPLLIVWGARDRIIPPGHGRRAHKLVAGSRFELFEAAGHFPHLDEPERFVATFEDWIATTEPGQPDDARFRAAVRRHVAYV